MACNISQVNISKCLEEINMTSGFVIWTKDVIQRVTTLAIIMVLSLVGNTTIVIVLGLSRYRRRHRRVNIFIVNLAIGDLTVCIITMTTEILFVAFGEWVLGEAACKILTYIQSITLGSTTFILTAMAYDRYMAICKPLRFINSILRAKKMIILSWIIAAIFAIPQIFIFIQTIEISGPNGYIIKRCRSKGYTATWQRKVYFTLMTFCIFLIPIFLIIFYYMNVVITVWQQGKYLFHVDSTSRRASAAQFNSISRAKLKTLKMTLCIVATFIVCWAPYFVVTLLRIYSDYSVVISPSVMALTETLVLLQSAMNPLFYLCFNVRFKREYLKMITLTTCFSKCRESSKSRSVTSGRNFTVDKHCHGRFSNNENYTSFIKHEKITSNKYFRSQRQVVSRTDSNNFKLKVRFVSEERIS